MYAHQVENKSMHGQLNITILYSNLHIQPSETQTDQNKVNSYKINNSLACNYYVAYIHPKKQYNRYSKTE